MNKALFSFLTGMFLMLFMSTITYSQEINCLDCHENLVTKTVHDKVIKCGDCHNDIKEEHAKGWQKK